MNIFSETIEEEKAKCYSVVKHKINGKKISLNFIANLFDGYSPSQIMSVYNNSYRYTGVNQKIGIICAHSYSTCINDFKLFCSSFMKNYDDNILTIHTMPDATFDIDWSIEQALNIQAVHAMAPNAKILLVQATDTTYYNLNEAIKYAIKDGCNIISIGWGFPDDGNNNPSNTIFNNPKIIFLAASGDNEKPSWPSLCKNVISVGGTKLKIIEEQIYEEGWYSEKPGVCGSGTSISEPINYIQKRFLPKFTNRTTPDVSMIADPQNGFPVVNTLYDKTVPIKVGGTSLSTSLWAGIIALVNECLNNNNKKDISQNVLLMGLYLLTQSPNYSKFINNIQNASDKNTSTAIYDNNTGLGTPNINNLVEYLANFI